AAEVDGHVLDPGEDQQDLGAQVAREQGRGQVLVDHGLDPDQGAVGRADPRGRAAPGSPGAGGRARPGASPGRRPRASPSPRWPCAGGPRPRRRSCRSAWGGGGGGGGPESRAGGRGGGGAARRRGRGALVPGGKAMSRHCWSMKPMPPWVSATQVSRGSRGSSAAARSLRSSTLPTWGPLRWVTTSGRSVKWARWSAVSMVRSYWTGMGLALPGGEMALPPRATTTGCSRTRSSWQWGRRAVARPGTARLSVERESPEGEPAGQLRLDRQVAAQGGLDPQL